MDDPVNRVLEKYHARIRNEQSRPFNGPPSQEDLDSRLLAVGPETGQLLNILVRSLVTPTVLELGTSYGYSGIWLAEAARATGGRVISMELQERKSAYAHQMAEQAGLADHIDFKVGDALQLIAELPSGIEFVLVDLWKDLYVSCLEAFYPKLTPGAIIVADNMLMPGGDEARRYRNAVRSKPGITSVLLPVGTGIEISRFQSN